MKNYTEVGIIAFLLDVSLGNYFSNLLDMPILKVCLVLVYLSPPTGLSDWNLNALIVLWNYLEIFF